MNAQPDTATTKTKRTNQPRITPYFIRGVKATTMRNGKSVLELEVGTSNRHLVTFDDHEQLAVLATVGITVHDGGKFYLGDVPMVIDQVTPIDLNVEFTSYLGGRKITGATVNTLDAKPAGGLTDAQFFAMWKDAADHSPSLKVVESDLETWQARLKGIIIRFYKAVYEGPESAELGRLAGEWVIEQCQQTRSCGNGGDERFIQNLLKRRLRADAPEGSEMAGKAKTTPKEFDLEASQADIGLRIRDGAKARNFETNEEAVLGKKAREFVTDETTYQEAIQKVAQFYGDLDAHMNEIDFLRHGIAANLTVTGLQDDAFAKDAALKEALTPYGEMTTLADVEHHKDYDRSVFLAAHLAACQAYLVKDKPKFENGTKAAASTKADDQDDFDVLHKLNNTDAPMDDKTPPPDEKPAESKPTTQTEPPKKFSLEEATQWVDDEKKLYPELNAMKIMTILKISGWREWQQQGHTLKDASEAVKRYLQDKAAAAMVEEGKAILKDKGVPIEEWPNIVEQAGDPKLMWEPSHMRATWLERVASNASAYVARTVTSEKKQDSTSTALTTTTNAPTALVPAPQPTAILSALKLPSPGEMQVMFEFAKAIADSTLFPGVDTPARAIAIMLKSLQMGIGAVDGFENVYIIPSKKGDRLYPSTNLLRGRVMANPICRKFDVMGDETKAVAIVMRVGDEGPTTYTYTIEDARKAGALDTYDDGNIKKPLWKQIPKTMLQHRVARMALFAKFPDLAIGLVPEDLDEEEVA